MHKEWLQVEENLEKPPNPRKRKAYRPEKNFSECSLRSKKMKTIHLMSASSEELLFALKNKFKNEGKKDAAEIISLLTSSNNEKQHEFLSKINEKNMNKYSSYQALHQIIYLQLSKHKYIFLRNEHINNKTDIYPPYKNVLVAKKECYPETIDVHKNKMIIKLQDLVDHTTYRFYELLKENLKEKTSSLIILYKYGFDGSGCHSIYNYKDIESEKSSNEEAYNQTQLFTSFICPIYIKDAHDSSLLWYNPSPSSPVYCRPLRMIYKAETEEIVKIEHSKIKDEIENLIDTKILNKIEFHHEFIQTMMDGKVTRIVTDGKSSSVCYICDPPTTPTNMNDLTQLLKKNICKEKLCYGIAPLHLYINTMECVLHISYRLPFKKWSIKKGSSNQIIAEEKKRAIKEKLKKRIGITIETPKHGFGSSHTGNMARTFFKNYKTTATITGFDESLMERLYIILLTLNSGFFINAAKFKEYAIETAKKYLKLYGDWYHMPVSMHRMLLHGSDIINALPISIGHSSEEGLEATHKIIRKIKEESTCKISKNRVNEDLIHWLLVASDPIIASYSKKTKTKTETSLPIEVINLLEEPLQNL